MTFSKLEQNIIDVIKEEQVKLGYRSETIRLYYPILSLNRLLGADYEVKQMTDILKSFCNHVQARLGKIEVSAQEERFCFTVPTQGTEYVHRHMGDKEFIVDLVNTISKHGVTIDEVLQQFYKYSDEVHIEKVSHGEFDYLVYFENGKPDDFRYCITDEGCHIVYHRFTVDDYNDFDFEV